ncbi:MAG: AsmA-like C-terminal domain-containing protein, partial [Rhodospirillaceae bacterium]|nr:AsmA-like C-terminal domain-containing protein [Rhodospirillaceae bacterium]
DVSGPMFDAQYFWKEFNKDDTRGQRVEDLPPPEEAPQSEPKDQTPVKISARFGEMWLNKDAPLKDVVLYFERDKRAIQKIDLDSKVSESGAPFTFAMGRKEGERTFSGQSDDGGGVVRSIGLFDDIKGGKLAITGEFTPQGAVEGEVNITEFKLVDAPMVARILSVAALTGIVDELRGEGISFKTLRVPFNFSASTLRIGEAEMFGNALGMTAKGTYRFPDSYIDIDGTVIPAYALNSALNSIPIVGTILTGPEKGGGIFAANFSWRGPSATAEPSVNPLSVLTPGITRKIFSIFSGGSSTPRKAPAAPAKPEAAEPPVSEPQLETVAPDAETPLPATPEAKGGSSR